MLLQPAAQLLKIERVEVGCVAKRIDRRLLKIARSIRWGDWGSAESVGWLLLANGRTWSV